MHGGGRAVKKSVKTQHAIMRAAALAGADGNRCGETAFALGLGEWGDKVFAHLYPGVIYLHKKPLPGMYPGLFNRNVKGLRASQRVFGSACQTPGRAGRVSLEWAPLGEVLARK
jgi:hypothetical protein